MATDLKNIAFDSTLRQGAFNAVNTCLRLRPDERITVITDRETMEIAAALISEIDEAGAVCSSFVIEDYAPRPLVDMPKAILDDLATSNVSIFAAQAQVGELGSRIQMTKVVDRNKIRHGHMVNINKQIMREGMRADFHEVDRLSTKVVERARRARSIRVTSTAGTNLVAEFSPNIKWLKTSGIISVEKWGNLPGGEVFTSPDNVNGVFVVDGVVGDYLCQEFGDLKNTPLSITIEHNRIKELNCSNKRLLEKFSAYTQTDDNSNRVGEFAIGTNIALKDVIGHILQDEKFPGVHLAFGHPYAEHTGQTWVSTTHIDVVGRNFNIWMDDEQIMNNGIFMI